MGVLGCCCWPGTPWHGLAQSCGVRDRGAGHGGLEESTGCPREPQKEAVTPEKLVWVLHLLAL